MLSEYLLNLQLLLKKKKVDYDFSGSPEHISL